MAGGLGNIGTAHITVEMDFDKAFRDAKQAESKIDPIQIKVEVDQSQVNREVGESVRTASLKEGTVDGRVELDQSQVSREVATKIGTAEKTEGKVNARVELDQSQVNSEVKKSLSTAARGPNGRFVAKGAVDVDRKSLNNARSMISTGLGGAFRSAARIGTAGLIGTAAAGALLFDQIRRGSEDAKVLSNSMAQVAASLKNFGAASGITSKQVQAVSSDMESFSSVTEESIQSSIATMTRFGIVNKKTLPSVTRLMLDTAAGMKQVNDQGEISPAFAIKFGRALQDPVKGLALMARGGVAVSASQKALIKDLVESGRVAEASAQVQQLLQKQFSGSAATFGTTIGGQLRLAADQFEDARRDLATKILPSIAPVLKQLGGEVAGALERNGPAITKFVTGFVKAAGAVVKFVSTNKEFQAVIRGVSAIVVGVVKGIGAFAKGLSDAFGGKKRKESQQFGQQFEKIAKIFGEKLVKGAFIAGKIVGLFIRVWGLLINKFKAGVGTIKLIIAVVKSVGEAIGRQLGTKIAKIAQDLQDLWAAAKTVFAFLQNGVGTLVKLVVFNFTIFKAALNALWIVAKAVFNALVAGVKIVGRIFGIVFAAIRLVFTKFVAGIRTIVTAVKLYWSAIGVATRALWDGMKSVFNRIREGISNLVKSIKDRIGGINLYQTGRNILIGLWDGLKDVWKDVRDWVSGLAAKIKSLKGPIAVDRTLLVDEGKAIMGGFWGGLRSRWANVSKWLKNLGPTGVAGLLLHPKQAYDTVANIVLGKGSASDLNKQLESVFGSAQGALAAGFLHPTSGWSDTKAQVQLIEKAFGVGMTSGLRPGSHTASGRVSQHALGQAADFGTSQAMPGALNNLAKTMSHLQRVFRQVIWLNRFWVNGVKTGSIGGHMDHVHLGWKPRAAGGQARRGETYRWKERGDEFFVPNQNGYVMNASRTKEMVSALRAIAQKPATNTNQQATVHIVSNAQDPRVVGNILMSNLGSVFSRV